MDSAIRLGQGRAMIWRTLFNDPLLRLLVLAVILAVLVPARGDMRSFAGWAGNAAIFVLFLLNGIRIARQDVRAGLGNWRFLLALVVWTFGAMALLGAGMAQLAQPWLSPLMALGLLFLGILPSTVQSATSYTALAEGDVALSVIGAAILNMVGMVLSVPIFIALGGAAEGAIGPDAAIKIVAILILPFVLGQILQTRVRPFVLQRKAAIAWLDRGIIALAVYVALSAAVDEGIADRVRSAEWLALVLTVGVMLGLAHGGAWLAGGLLRLNPRQRIAFLFGGAQKSAAVGAPLATILFAPRIAGVVVIPLLLYHFLQLVLAAPLASALQASRQPPDGGDYTAPTTTERGQSAPPR